MNSLLQDLRYALRSFTRSPAFAATAVATLALGIGANAAIFSLVDAVLLRPLPYPDAERIVTLGEAETRETAHGAGGTSFANFFDWQAQSRDFEAMTIFNGWKPALTGLGEADRIPAAFVSAGVFDVLRVQPAVGRATRPDEDRADAPPVVVVSHGFWLRRLGGDPSALGRSITLNGLPFTVVGVLPAGFRPAPPEIDVDVWANNYPDPRDTRSSRYLRAMGRLKPGVSLEAARAELKTISARLEAAYPKEDGGMTAVVLPLRRALTADTRSPLLFLFAASTLLLAIACANVGNLLIASGTARGPEFALRAALGASRWRLVRQLLTESAVLAASGAAWGLLLAPWAGQILLVFAPDSLRAAGVHTDRRVLLFALGTSLCAVLLAGLLPALRVAPRRLETEIRRSRSAGLHAPLRNGLAVAQLGLALALLGIAGLLAKSLHEVSRVDPGIAPTNVWTLSLNVPEARYPKARQPQFFDELAARAAALPGVRSAAVSSAVPFSNDWDRISVDVAGRPRTRGVDRPEGDRYIVSSGYFATMGIPLKAGRLLSEADRDDTPPVAVVDEVFARQLEKDGPVIGARLKLPARDEFAEVVGIVGHVRHYGLDATSGGQIYMSQRQYPWRWMHLLVRADAGAIGLPAALRGTVRALDPDVPVFDLTTMDALMAERSSTRSFSTLLAIVFAAAAVALAAIGLFGLVSYMVEQRRPELAIRMTLGAAPASIARLVLGEGLRLGLRGTLWGLLGAFVGGRLASGMLFHVKPLDPGVLAAVAALLVAITLAASWLPARRAARVDPLAALRGD